MKTSTELAQQKLDEDERPVVTLVVPSAKALGEAAQQKLD